MLKEDANMVDKTQKDIRNGLQDIQTGLNSLPTGKVYMRTSGKVYMTFRQD